ncbi:RNA polymerase I associated factor, A49-like protein [Bombardia bombarda]|uniref:RNA polymerase I associated factor, A49-like protein n=1 Tax=Bombardia bombarda TaxID=252184 RepID=A0AA39WT92_9PEZI|nr:RNA polymerase I associated factor, A49-like protein [Bombardia bombarda]
MANSPDNKRKRSNGASSKKVDFEKPQKAQKGPRQVQVTSVVKPQFAPPVIAVIPGFDLPNSAQFNTYTNNEKPAPKRRKNDPPPSAPELLLHSTSHRSLDYTAREDHAVGTQQMLKHYIGIFDPRSGEVQIVEGRKMVVRGVVRSQVASDDAMVDRTVRQNMRDMKNDLGETFGTKKAKKAIKSVTENAITAAKGVDKLGKGDLALMDTIQDSAKDMATREELQAAVDSARPVPRCNPDADEIQDVYVPAEIIGTEVLNAIPVMDWQEMTQTSEPVLVPSRYVANRVNRVAGNEDAVQRLKVLRYLLWVLIFWATTTQGKQRGTFSIGKRDKLREVMHPAPEVVIENIRRKFSDNGVMRKTDVDLLMTHCCAFASIIDNFEVNTFDLREDLKLEQKQLNQYFMEIGARIKQSKSGDKVEHFAKLTLPLQFPKIRQARRT